MPIDIHGINWDQAGRNAVDLFRGLVRIDTSNPPGHESQAADYLARSLSADGLDPWVDQSKPGRGNLVVRLPATVDPPTGGPLLLAGPTDVAPVCADRWTHLPADGERADDRRWGRGTGDMKYMVAMSVMVAKLMARQNRRRTRDLIVAAVADEDTGCDPGSQYLVEHHPERVNADFMLGEGGGFWQHIGPQSYIPITVAQKGSVHLRLTAHGPTGHASIPRPDNALVQLASAIEKLGRRRLPYHLTPVMEDFIRKIADSQPMATSMGLKSLLNSRLNGPVLDKLMPTRAIARHFDALLHNTVSPTLVDAGRGDVTSRLEVLPDRAACELDGRTLPYFSGQDLADEVVECIDDDDINVEVVSAVPGVQTNPIGSPLLDIISETLAVHAPQSIPAPYMLPGHTDARHFSRLGMRCYGFSPLKLPADGKSVFNDPDHRVDERLPVDGFVWGQRVLFDVVSRFLDQ